MLSLFLLAELAILYFLSRWLTQRLFNLFLLTFRARSVAVMLVTLLQFPGTVVHELAHLFTAGILGVHAGKLTLAPESIRGEDIRVGSVMVAQTGPIRRYAIGLAPIFAGMLCLTAIAYFLPDLTNSVFVASKGEALQASPFWQNPSFYFLLIAGYLMFAVSNAMFSSPEDLKGFAPFAIVVGIFASAAYFLGLRIALTGASLALTNRILTTLVRSLGIVLGVNAVLLIITLLWTRLIEKISHKKIVHA